MDIIVFSDLKNIPNIFCGLEKSGTHTLRFLPLKALKKTVRGLEPPCLVYVDVSCVSDTELDALLKTLHKSPQTGFGIIDPRDSVKDKAALFFRGAADYLGRAQCKEGVSAARIKDVLEFLETGKDLASPAAGRRRKNHAASVESGRRRQETAGRRGKVPAAASLPKTAAAAASKVQHARNWGMVQPGNEYMFYLMFVELDGQHELSQRIGEKAVGELLFAFQSLVKTYTAAEKGRLWIWNDFGGIVLFPFTTRPSAIISSCMRLMLSRRIISIERCAPKMLLSYRIVLHTGSTVYRERGKTGRIISDAVNSLSHMGYKFARPGNMYITDEIFSKTPQSMRDCFKTAGQFQCFELHRMKLPLRY
jgi:class 3 adenylate cyclase